MHVSDEEVALHGGSVVCPQCLAVYTVGDVDVSPDAVIASRTATATEPAISYGYCYSCGKKIPAGINYCPFCGKSLSQEAIAAMQQQQQQQQVAASRPAATQVAATTATAQPKAKGGDTQPDDAAKASSDIDWKPFLPTYHFSVADRQAQREKHRASRTFTFVALVIIVAQLALLAFIIHKAMRYLPPLFDTTLTN